MNLKPDQIFYKRGEGLGKTFFLIGTIVKVNNFAV